SQLQRRKKSGRAIPISSLPPSPSGLSPPSHLSETVGAGYRHKRASRIITGNGMPKSQSSAPLPNVMTASISPFVIERLATANVPSIWNLRSNVMFSIQNLDGGHHGYARCNDLIFWLDVVRCFGGRVRIACRSDLALNVRLWRRAACS